MKILKEKMNEGFSLVELFGNGHLGNYVLMS